jgi:hypothetical protein
LTAKKFLKNDWKQFIEQNNITKFDEYCKLTLEKSIVIGVDGSKTKHKGGKLIVNYKLIKEDKEVIEKGVALIKALPEDSFVL